MFIAKTFHMDACLSLEQQEFCLKCCAQGFEFKSDLSTLPYPCIIRISEGGGGTEWWCITQI